MHVHVFNQVSLRPANTWDFPLFVANGVLGVREMWTKPGNMAEIRRWRNGVWAGTLIAPRVAAVGRVLDGPSPVWRNTDSVTTLEDALAARRRDPSRGNRLREGVQRASAGGVLRDRP